MEKITKCKKIKKICAGAIQIVRNERQFCPEGAASIGRATPYRLQRQFREALTCSIFFLFIKKNDLFLQKN